MTTRTIYYLVLRFNIEKGLIDGPVDNDYLTGIYVQEVSFNFIVFYNLVVK
jgi:Zn-dependent M32 family carboxypeptidase